MKRFQALVLITAAAFLNAGCGLFSSSGIILQFPPADETCTEAGINIEAWVIEYPSAIEDGIPVYSELEFRVTGTVPAELSLTVARGINLPVIATPVFNFHGDVSLTGNYPAGAVYPEDIDGGVLVLDWQHGFACGILKRCLMNSDMIKGFDTASFREALNEKASEISDSDEGLPGGVWFLDPDPIISRLGYGLFRTSSIRAAETGSFSIPASGGVFVSDNPFYPPVEASAGFLEVTVPVNRRTSFFNTGSDGGIIELYFDESFWCWLKPLSGESESGRM